MNGEISAELYSRYYLEKPLINCKDKYNKKKNLCLSNQCEDCDALYIGQTGRNCISRFNEYLRSWESMNSNYLFSNPLLEKNRKFNFEENKNFMCHWKTFQSEQP